MPQLLFNFDEIAAAEPVEEGTYLARIDDVQERTGQQPPHNPYWNVELTIQDERALGRKVWDVFMLQPQSLWKLKRLLQCVGLQVDGRRSLDTDDELRGREVIIKVVNELYEGQLRSRVKGYLPVK